jgi:hypothetical protein
MDTVADLLVAQHRPNDVWRLYSEALVKCWCELRLVVNHRPAAPTAARVETIDAYEATALSAAFGN